MTSPSTTILRSGVSRGLIEFRQAFSGTELVGQLFWPAATLVAIYFFRERTIDGSDVALGTIMLPGVLGMFVAFGMVLMIQFLAADREDGTLLRAKATPGGIPSYLISKIVNVSLSIVVYLLLVAVPGSFLVHGLNTGSLHAWVTVAWVLGLGLVATQLLGAVLGSLVASPRAASFVALLVMVLVAVSGIFYPLAALPTWLQWVGQATPIYWLGLGMRSALLPEAAAVVEISGSWRTLETAAALSVSIVVGLVVAPMVLRQWPDGSPGRALRSAGTGRCSELGNVPLVTPEWRHQLATEAPDVRYSASAARPLGLLIGYLADLAFGDPHRWHPVAGFGLMAARLERTGYADRRTAGVVQVVVLVGATAGAAAVAEFGLRNRPVARTLLTAAATWAVLGGRSLRAEAHAVGEHLGRDDLAAARVQITHLVGRNPESLDADGIARACVESVAENTSDAVVGPLLWGALVGLPGLVGYRAINTLDAMIGHRSARYLRFGWAAARLDDLVNLLPSRLTAAVVIGLAPVLGGRSGSTARVVARDAGRHPSPNAGPVEAAFAGALGVTLGGVNIYDDAVEDRGTLGAGPSPRPADIARATRLSAAVGGVVAGLAVGAAGVVCRRGPCMAAER